MVDKTDIEQRISEALEAKAKRDREQEEANAKRSAESEAEHREFVDLIDSVVKPVFEAVADTVISKGYPVTIAEKMMRDDMAYANHSSITITIKPANIDAFNYQNPEFRVMKNVGRAGIKMSSSITGQDHRDKYENVGTLDFKFVTEEKIMGNVLAFIEKFFMKV